MRIATGQKGLGSIKDIAKISKFEQNYDTEDSLEYREKLKKMNLSELQEHAANIGRVPGSDRKKLEAILASEFETNKRNYKAASAIKGIKKSLTAEQIQNLKKIETEFLSR